MITIRSTKRAREMNLYHQPNQREGEEGNNGGKISERDKKGWEWLMGLRRFFLTLFKYIFASDFDIFFNLWFWHFPIFYLLLLSLLLLSINVFGFYQIFYLIFSKHTQHICAFSTNTPLSPIFTTNNGYKYMVMSWALI